MYEPNFNNAGVRAKCENALGFAISNFSQHKPKAQSTRYIDKWFGQAQTPVCKYLRSKLLIVSDNHWNMDTGKCKKYLLNYEGAKQLHNTLWPNIEFTVQRERQVCTQSAETKYLSELQSGDFVYKDKSNRLWHPLQNHNTVQRRHTFATHGYNHIYDIRACAPTVIAHLASALAPRQTKRVLHMNSVFDNFLLNIDSVRQQIASDTHIDYSTTKRIINALFAGAKMGTQQSSIFELLNRDYDRMHLLQTNEHIVELKTAISKAWNILCNSEIDGEPVVNKRGNSRVNSKHKWAVYFEYERLIMDQVVEYLNSQHVKHFLEHDGWSCTVQLDLAELTQLMRTKTGIHTLTFDYKGSTSTDVPVEQHSLTSLLAQYQ